VSDGQTMCARLLAAAAIGRLEWSKPRRRQRCADCGRRSAGFCAGRGLRADSV